MSFWLSTASVKWLYVWRKPSGSSLLNPKSRNATTGPGNTSMFPGCGSAWKKPLTRICSQYASIMMRATTFGSMPAATSSSVAEILMPSMYSIVSTRRAVRSHTIAGTRTSPRCARSRATRSALRPSRSKSSSRGTFTRISRATTRKSKRDSSRASSATSSVTLRRSVSTTRSMPAYCTFTAASRPSCVRARCTCASDAAAIGSREKLANASSGAAPSSRRTCAATSA